MGSMEPSMLVRRATPTVRSGEASLGLVKRVWGGYAC
jgi:hypothetical protein